MHYDAELQSHNAALLPACAIRSHEHVLDIGCGTGQTTREAARLAATGSALGVDITEQMIVRARALAAAEGVHNVQFELGDAQVHGFLPQHYDVAISRYGTMFFADPIAAFRNIGGALRPGGRLIMMVWQAHEANEWSVAVDQALAPYERPSSLGVWCRVTELPVRAHGPQYRTSRQNDARTAGQRAHIGTYACAHAA